MAQPAAARHVREVCGLVMDMTQTAIAEVIGRLQREGVRSEVYELKVPPNTAFEALRVVEPINKANIGFFVKITVEWSYEKPYEWSLRSGDVEVWSPGA